jgi:hypothetical protein
MLDKKRNRGRLIFIGCPIACGWATAAGNSRGCNETQARLRLSPITEERGGKIN